MLKHCAFVAGLAIMAFQPAFGAEKVDEDTLKTALRNALPPEAKCELTTYGPRCRLEKRNFKLDTIFDGITVAYDFRIYGPAVTGNEQDWDDFMNLGRRFAKEFAFTDAQIEQCIKAPKQSGLKQAGEVKDAKFILYCTIAEQVSGFLVTFGIAPNNEF